MVGPLPSKQICAGSSPVSRSNNIGVMDKCLTPIYAGCLMQKPKPMPWERRWRRDGTSPSPGLKILPIIIMCRCSLVDRAATQYWVVVTGSSPVGGQGVWRFRQKPRNHLAPCGRLEMSHLPCVERAEAAVRMMPASRLLQRPQSTLPLCDARGRMREP